MVRPLASTVSCALLLCAFFCSWNAVAVTLPHEVTSSGASATALLRSERARSESAKARRNSAATLVFVAGLEGTGHHLMGAVLDQARQQNSAVFKNASFTSQVARALFPENAKKLGLTPVSRQTLSKLLLQTTADSPGKLVAVNCVPGLPPPGMMSYPDRSAYSTSPDLAMLHGAAGDAGVDLRVLVTLRGTEAMIRNGCVKNDYAAAHPSLSGCMADADRLKQHGQLLLRQLRSLPREHVLCLQYEDFVAHGKPVSAFLGQDLGTIMEETYKPTKRLLQQESEVDAAAPVLESTNQELYSFCGL